MTAPVPDKEAPTEPSLLESADARVARALDILATPVPDPALVTVPRALAEEIRMLLDHYVPAGSLGDRAARLRAALVAPVELCPVPDGPSAEALDAFYRGCSCAYVERYIIRFDESCPVHSAALVARSAPPVDEPATEAEAQALICATCGHWKWWHEERGCNPGGQMSGCSCLTFSPSAPPVDEEQRIEALAAALDLAWESWNRDQDDLRRLKVALAAAALTWTKENPDG